MALTPLSGSSTTPSGPRSNQVDVPKRQSDVVPNMPFITNSALNKTAIDTTQYPEVTKQLLGFMRGKRILVTYYRLISKEGNNNRSHVTDLATSRNIIHTEYQKINRLEITLPKAFTFESDSTSASMSISGEALFYPNMNPNLGDIFLMGTGDGRVGLCRISKVVPMTWRTDRIYSVQFIVQKFVDASLIDPIEGSVVDTLVFRKENYLGETVALLSEETYDNLQKIAAYRSMFCKVYHQRFFDPNTRSYFRPDGGYDPWVVKFICGKLTLDDVPVRPKNLYGNFPTEYAKTLWSRFDDRAFNSLQLLSATVDKRTYRAERLGVFVSELHNKYLLRPSDNADTPGAIPYLYSAAFYAGRVADMSAEELLVYRALIEGHVGDLNVLIAGYLSTALSLPIEEQFYKIPLYIHLMDMAMQSEYREVDAPWVNFFEGDIQAVEHP